MSNQEGQAKVKKPFYKKVWFWILLVLVAAIGVGGGSSSSNDAQTITETNGKNAEAEKEEEAEEIVYTAYTVSQMMKDLDGNALKAESTYNKQYVEITGRLAVIDSSGSYISLFPEDDEWAITGVQCYIKTDEQKEKVMEMSLGDTVTLRGKITTVGEVMGYSLDIDSINE